MFLTAHLCELIFSFSFQGHFICFQEVFSDEVRSMSIFAQSRILSCMRYIFE